jgi:hypothetical protein
MFGLALAADALTKTADIIKALIFICCYSEEKGT